MDMNRNKKTNKNRHRNQKLQRFRRQCRAKGMNNETIQMLITLKSSNKPTQYQNHINQDKSTQEKLLLNYNKLSSQQFKDLLSTGLRSYRDEIYQFLTNSNICRFIQQHATFLCTYFQLKIEEDYWNYISNLSNTPIFNWLIQLSKDVMLENSMDWDQTVSSLKIKRRQKLIQNKLKQVETDLNIHLQHYPLNLINENATYIEHCMKIIRVALAIVIYNDLELFHMNFERQKILVYLAIKDALFVKLFYDLKPTEKQVRAAQKIWRNESKLWKEAIVHTKNHRWYDNRISDVDMRFDDNHSVIHNVKHQLPSIESDPSTIYPIIQARLYNIQQRSELILQPMDNIFFK